MTQKSAVLNWHKTQNAEIEFLCLCVSIYRLSLWWRTGRSGDEVGIRVAELNAACAVYVMSWTTRDRSLTGHYLQNSSAAQPASYTPGNDYSHPCTSEIISRITPTGITARSFTKCINYGSNSLWAFNPLNTKRKLLYLKTQFVPRSKHFSSRL